MRADLYEIERLEFFGICLAAILIIGVIWELFRWFTDGPDDRE